MRPLHSGPLTNSWSSIKKSCNDGALTTSKVQAEITVSHQRSFYQSALDLRKTLLDTVKRQLRDDMIRCDFWNVVLRRGGEREKVADSEMS